MSLAPLISATELGKEFGTKQLFSGITISINQGERVALIGPNGSGKSTLLRMLAGIEDPDHGQVRARNGLRAAYVAQEDSFDMKLSVAETLEATLAATGHANNNDYLTEGRIEELCGRSGFKDKHAKVATLSGGWRKRLAILRGLIVEPELLLLDEPTNHLDINAVLWLEDCLASYRAAILFVSHDRYFIERLATRVVEINPKYPRGFFSSQGGYADFLESREAFLVGLQQTRDRLANRVRREVEWLRQGARARTTKSKHRSAEAGRLVNELRGINLDEQQIGLQFAASGRKSRDLIKVENISKKFDERPLFKNVTLTLSPGMRLGIVGPNGSGKTTFLKTLLGQLEPDSGRVKSAKNLRIAFFDQARTQLNRVESLKTALCREGDAVIFNGRQIHVAGWAERFLFNRNQLTLPVGSLSGGEQARVLLARIMLEESDLLLFDEPTNDLDIRTLEVLEESFQEYPGAIVLITHDRYLLDRTATMVLGLGEVMGQLYSNYSQWEFAMQEQVQSKKMPNRKGGSSNNKAEAQKEKTTLSYNEKRELETIEKDILKAEKMVSDLESEIVSERVLPDPMALKEFYEKLSLQQRRVEELYARWEELEEVKKQVKEAKARSSI